MRRYQLLSNGKEKIGMKQTKLTEYSQTIDDVYENLDNYNPTKKIKVLEVFDDMIADIKANKKLSPIVTELFLRGRKL